MGLGIKFFIIQMAMVFIFQSTNIIIAQILGPEQVTVYNIAYKYFTIPMTIALIVVSPLWSAFTDAYTKKDYNWMKKTNEKLYLFAGLISLVLIIFLLCDNIAYELWIGKDILIPHTISFLMFLNIVAATNYNIFAFIVSGTGKLKLILYTHLCLSIFYIPIGYLVGKKYQLGGILFVNIVVNCIYLAVIILQTRKIVMQKAVGIWNK